VTPGTGGVATLSLENRIPSEAPAFAALEAGNPVGHGLHAVRACRAPVKEAEGNPARSRCAKVGLQTHSHPRGRDWANEGLLAIDMANLNSWHTLERAVLLKSNTDMVLAQEAKLLDLRLGAATTAARNAGWNPTLARAHRTSASMASGGAAVFASSGTGIRQLTDNFACDGMKHRLCISWVDAVVRGGLYCMSRWLRDPARAHGLREVIGISTTSSPERPNGWKW